MSNHTMMDPREFAERLERSFGTEPPHANPSDDLAHGRRRLRRRRAGTTFAALAVAGIVSAGAVAAPGLLPHEAREAAPATAPAVRALTADDIVARCTTGENAFFLDGSGSKQEQAAVRLLGEHPRLMTSAVVDQRTEATLLSENGDYWGDCQFRNTPDASVKNTVSVFPTAVDFRRTTVGGVDAYEPASEADLRFVGGLNTPVPQFEVPCLRNDTSSEDELAAAEAQCPRFTIYWNDRRPAEVAAVRVTTPDGVSTWADVKKGYLSFAYTGAMTPALAEQVAVDKAPGATRITFFDKDGNVLVDDRDPGHFPDGEGDISILNFPSLAWWLG